MREIGCKSRDRMGTTGRTAGREMSGIRFTAWREKSRDGNQVGTSHDGRRRDEKSREYTVRRDGKQAGTGIKSGQVMTVDGGTENVRNPHYGVTGNKPGREQHAVCRDGRRWERDWGRGGAREVAVGNGIHSGFPFLSRKLPTRPPFPDTTNTARTLTKNDVCCVLIL